jgi:hypothetical protein
VEEKGGARAAFERAGAGADAEGAGAGVERTRSGAVREAEAKRKGEARTLMLVY